MLTSADLVTSGQTLARSRLLGLRAQSGWVITGAVCPAGGAAEPARARIREKPNADMAASRNWDRAVKLDCIGRAHNLLPGRPGFDALPRRRNSPPQAAEAAAGGPRRERR